MKDTSEHNATWGGFADASDTIAFDRALDGVTTAAVLVAAAPAASGGHTGNDVDISHAACPPSTLQHACKTPQIPI